MHHRAVDFHLFAIPAEAELLRAAGDEWLLVFHARAEDADVDQVDRMVLHPSFDRRHEEQSLRAAAFLFEHGTGGNCIIATEWRSKPFKSATTASFGRRSSSPTSAHGCRRWRRDGSSITSPIRRSFCASSASPTPSPRSF